MKIQFLIPHYDETEEEIAPLLDSIALQQRVDFSEIGAVICSDGGKRHLRPDFLERYPFDIEYHIEPHRGVSATRNACLDYATAEYVMFCDADDMFCNACGLWFVLKEAEVSRFDSLTSAFIEETKDPDGEFVFVTHQVDSTFVHGKVHRRKYLADRNIRFNDELTIHEDSYFNILAQNCSENVRYCPTVFYLWKWRDNSVCRHDPKYLLKTSTNMLDSTDALLAQLEARGMLDKAPQFAVQSVFECYYMMSKPEWINQENQEYRDKTERRFAQFFKKHRHYWDAMAEPERMMISNGVRGRQVMEGMGMEQMTISQWLAYIETLA